MLNFRKVELFWYCWCGWHRWSVVVADDVVDRDTVDGVVDALAKKKHWNKWSLFLATLI